MYIAGAPESGKSHFVKQLLETEVEEGIYEEPFDRVVLCYSKMQDLYIELQSLFERSGKCKFELHSTVPWEDIEEGYEGNSLLIFDDMMLDLKNDNRLASLFTRGRHKKYV